MDPGLRRPATPPDPMADPAAERARLAAMTDPSRPAAGCATERPWTLGAAAALVAAEALVEAVAVAGRSSLTPGLRAGLVLCIALKWAAAAGVLRRSAGAALGLLLLQGTTVVAAFGAVDSPLALRLALGAVAGASIALLLASLHAFPSPDLRVR